MEILLGSEKILNKLQVLFRERKELVRRVACVAYIGKDVLDFIPDPKGVEIYCWPQPGATSAQGVMNLIKAGAIVKFVDKLHSKIFWTEDSGGIIGSANLSSNALGEGNLIEAGVFLKEFSKQELDDFLKTFVSRDVTDTELRKLYKEDCRFYQNYKSKKKKVQYPEKSFLEWYDQDQGKVFDWYLGYWSEYGKPARESKLLVRSLGIKNDNMFDFINMPKGDWTDKWVLTFKYSVKNQNIVIDQIFWRFYDHSVTVLNNKENKNIYEKDYPSQAIQIKKLNSNITPPFKLDKNFKKAFTKSIKELGPACVEGHSKNCRPSKKLLNKIYKNLPK